MDKLQLGEKAFDQGQYLKALNYFLEDYEITKDLDTLLNIGVSYHSLERFDEALSTYFDIINQDTSECRAFYGIACVYDEQQDFEKAITYYLKAIDINPIYDEAFFSLAQAYDLFGDVESAIKTYKELLEISPTHLDALINISALYENKQLYDFAYKYAKQATQLYPHIKNVQFNFAVILNKLSRPKKATFHYLKALEIDSQDAYIYLNLAIIAKDLGDLNLGIDYLTKGISEIETSFLYYNRACFYSLLGELEFAREDLNHAILLQPAFLEYSKKDKELEPILLL